MRASYKVGASKRGKIKLGVSKFGRLKVGASRRAPRILLWEGFKNEKLL